ncbi:MULTISPECIES: GNAT family N-acetyltransferase [Methylorubrum]|uniref:GNAT family N-acetyltransferase n=1 Tax=Methylorubrum TaxID=2282523 RepID=UPI0020A1A66A|nr:MULTISPECIES: GNAT family N-acetyltransferase [Methylorubrum]MCP1547630.1 CelD/BcsL family acetyltransferase involved in cellulose biosynthesis [Methylorubrum zatmanii]MCP1555754.1 CelD/BcsL family acetyltransferase involved in cellulose biosynthesis [Methylorubrum extorquens]MCP1577933.1 CelD/BcsL family acetyltransferase involved in cellulose biosynthesis [Methylorubrum extorquens]
MAALAEDLGRPVRAELRGHGGLTAEVFSDLAAVEGLWRGLESNPAVLMTPYQRFDWVAAYLGAGIDAGEETRILVLRDAHGRVRLLLPFAIGRRGPLRVARVVGDRHANFHMPLFASREAAAMPAEDLTEALVRAGRAAGIDAFALRNQPRVWDGTPNPLAGGGLPAPSDAYGMLLGPDTEATLRRVFSGDTRKKLRAKERKLVEFLGAVEHRVAETPEAAAEIQAAFYAQKAARFADLGVADPYADAEIRRFIAAATVPGAEGRAAAIETHALVASESGRILATFGGAVDGARFCGMWTSFDTDPELGRFSPGEILLHRLVGDQAARGRRALDLGVGEAGYKAKTCDETIELVEQIVPVSPASHALVLASRLAVRLKHRIKRSPRLWAAAQNLRRRLRR